MNGIDANKTGKKEKQNEEKTSNDNIAGNGAIKV